jgi:hypothetical protein
MITTLSAMLASRLSHRWGRPGRALTARTFMAMFHCSGVESGRSLNCLSHVDCLRATLRIMAEGGCVTMARQVSGVRTSVFSSMVVACATEVVTSELSSTVSEVAVLKSGKPTLLQEHVVCRAPCTALRPNAHHREAVAQRLYTRSHSHIPAFNLRVMCGCMSCQTSCRGEARASPWP